MALTLYYHPLASYCHKVLIALYEHGVDFDKRIVDLGNAQDRAELKAIWPMAKFPVLHDRVRQRLVPESTVIIEYLDHFYPGKQLLIPESWDDAMQVRLWDRFFDSYVHGPMQEIVNDRIRQANGDMTPARSMLNTAYEMIDRQLASRQWVAGEHFSMADCAAVPALFYATTLVPLRPDLMNLGAYFERLMSRASCTRVIDEAKPYLSMYPFADAIPERFR
jgi:glutathione S-transferase